MKHIIAILTLLATIALQPLRAQDDVDGVAEQIRKDRALEIENLNKSLETNKGEIARLSEELSTLKEEDVKGRMQKLEELNSKQDERLTILENKRAVSISANGQLAFTELLNLQNDIKPIELFSASQRFFNALGNVSNLQQYESFSSWKKTYDSWYQKKGKGDKTMGFIDQSIQMISDVANKLPLYGSIISTVSSGVLSIISGSGKGNDDLVDKTPKMLTLLNVVGQFENQRAIIDHEWKSINEELEYLKSENKALLDEQIEYYGLSAQNVRAYSNATLGREKEKYQMGFKKSIQTRMNELGNDESQTGLWTLQVEKYMYRVQSMRVRFGQLASRMLTNIKRYEEIITLFSDPSRIPPTDPAFSRNIANLRDLLNNVKSTFERSFDPARYIEDSAIMYID